jgi:hypothetical protein
MPTQAEGIGRGVPRFGSLNRRARKSGCPPASGTIALVQNSAGLAAAGTLVSAAFTAALGRRWLSSRRPFLRSWTVSLAAFTVSIGALAYGAAAGCTEPVVRTYYVFGPLHAPAPLPTAVLGAAGWGGLLSGIDASSPGRRP